MKNILIAIGCGTALFFTGCKEVPPTINYNNANYTDTTYAVSSIPASQPHNVLIEEYTGESCTNCPAAHTQLDGLVAGNPAGRINVVSLYENSLSPLVVPPDGANYDFRSNVASDILNSSIYSINASGKGNLPGAGVDRVPVTPGTTVYLGSSAWNGLATSRMSLVDSLNLDLSSRYDAASGTDTIVATITYTQSTSSLQNLSIVIVEDSIVDYQEFPFGAINSSYVFNDVLVSMVSSSPFGDPVLTTKPTKEGGRVLRRTYIYKVPTSFKKGIVYPAHCRVIAFVNRPSNANANFEVLQSQQTKLMGP